MDNKLDKSSSWQVSREQENLNGLFDVQLQISVQIISYFVESRTRIIQLYQ
jgi:hypothetical protein